MLFKINKNHLNYAYRNEQDLYYTEESDKKESTFV